MSDMEHDLDEEGLEALRTLPREMVPPAGLDDRVVAALKAEGLLRTRPSTHGRGRRLAWLAAVAAGVALFASGMVVGQWNATRGIVDAVARARPDDAAAQAAQVQEAGSDYVRAVAHLADLAVLDGEQAVAPGREAARVALHAAALELARMSPDDPTLRLILGVLEDRLQEPGHKESGTVRTTIWF